MQKAELPACISHRRHAITGGAQGVHRGTGVGREHDASGSIRRPKDHRIVNSSITFEREPVIPTCTLDDRGENTGVRDVDFIWVDVQGAEVDVFRGGRATLERTRFV